MILCGFHILHPEPTHLLAPLLLTLALQPPRKTKLKSYKIKKKQQTKNILQELVVCSSEFTVYPLVHTSLLVNVHCNEPLGMRTEEMALPLTKCSKTVKLTLVG